MKDTKEKETKRFRLQSILKLHNRILDDRLITIAKTCATIIDAINNKEVKDNKDIVDLLENMLNFIALTGSHNNYVVAASKELQLSSEQSELSKLYRLVTQSLEEHEQNVINDVKKEAEEQKAKQKIKKTSTYTITANSKEDAVKQLLKILEEEK